MKKKFGRPRLSKEKRKTGRIAVRLLEEEQLEVENAIAKSGKKQGDWLRDALLSKARRKK